MVKNSYSHQCAEANQMVSYMIFLFISFLLNTFSVPLSSEKHLLGLFPEPFPFWNWDIRWYVKRFLHPDIVANYDYIFIWDEDLGVEHFNADE